MTTKRPLGPCLAVLAGLAVASPLSAEDIGGVTVRGFVSQGYLKSSANKYLANDTDDGTFAFTEAALNFTAEPVSKIRVAAQLFARDFGQQGNNRVVLDWGLGEYRPLDQLGFRAGRMKFPVGLYNTLQDADVARPEIFQPSGVYPPDRRDLTNAVDGGGLFGTIRLGGAGYLEYEGQYGALDLEDTYILKRATDQLGAALVPALGAVGFQNISTIISERDGHSRHAFGTYVEWHPPIAGLRLRPGFQGAEVDFGALSTYTAFAGPAPVALTARTDVDIDVKQVTLSAEYTRGGLRLTVEHARSRNETTTNISGAPFPVPPGVPVITYPSSTYGQAAYRFNEHVQASSYYSVSYANRKDKDGVALAMTGQPASNAWTKDLAFTLRLDLNAYALLKVEFHRFDGTFNLSQLENPKPLEPEWNLFAVKATLHF